MTATDLPRIEPRHRQLPPFPTWHGHPVRWEDRGVAPRIVCAKIGGCEGCTSREPPLVYAGYFDPQPGDTLESTHMKRARRSGRSYGVPRRIPAWPYVRLMALLCRVCGRFTYLDEYDDAAVFWEVFCDGCDRLLGIGATQEEAHAAAVTVHAIVSGDDVDLCPPCAGTVRPLHSA